MGFSWPTAPTSWTQQKVGLRVRTTTEFEIIAPFVFTPTDGSADVLVPAYLPPPPGEPDYGYGVTDFASVPKFLWGLFASYGRQLPAALVHDHLCKVLSHAPADQRGGLRDRADGIFLMALKDDDLGPNKVPKFRARLFWTGVSVARYGQYHRLRGLLVLAEALALLAAVVAGAHLLAARVPLDVLDRLKWWQYLIVVAVAATLAWWANIKATKKPTVLMAQLRLAMLLVGTAALAAVLYRTLPWWTPAETVWWTLLVVAGVLLLAGLSLPAPDRLLPFTAALMLPILLPAVVFTLLAAYVLWVPDAVRASGSPSVRPPEIGPSIIRPGE